MLFHFGDGQPFTGGAALMEAVVRVGEDVALVIEHADLVGTHAHDATVPLLELCGLADELLEGSRMLAPLYQYLWKVKLS